MRVDGKQGAGIPQDEPKKSEEPKKRGRGRPPKNAPKVEAAKTIHNIQILDKSGSMGFGWNNIYPAAMEGMSLNHRQLGFELAQQPNLKYVLTYVTFNSNYSTRERSHSTDLDFIYKGADYNATTAKDIDWSNRSIPGGGTPLHDTIYAIGEYIKGSKAPKADKVLISIYTDGDENTSTGPIKDKRAAAAYIKDLQENHNCTVTFVGLKDGVDKVVSDLGLHSSNTMTYDGTAAGMAKSMMSNSVSRAAFSSAVINNEDVTRGFYKKLNDE